MSSSLLGILVTVAVLGVLITIHELGHYLAAVSLGVPVREFAIGFGPRLLGRRVGETDFALNLIPLGGYCAFLDDFSEEGSPPSPQPPGPSEAEAATPGSPDLAAEVDPEDPRLLRNRAVWERTWVVSAGVIFNYVSAWLILLTAALWLGVPTGREVVGVKAVLPNTPAAAVGLAPGDRLVQVNGQGVQAFAGFKKALVEAHGQPIRLEVDRGGQALSLEVKPTAEGTLGFRPTIKPERRPVGGLGEAMGAATQSQWEYTTMLTGALAGIFAHPSTAGAQLGGPLMIVDTGKEIFQVDPTLLVNLAVVLSIELAIINLLPLPALDGGHLVFLALEKLRGQPLPRLLEQRILVAGFMTLLGLGVVLIGKDLFTLGAKYGGGNPPSAPAASPAPAHHP